MGAAGYGLLIDRYSKQLGELHDLRLGITGHDFRTRDDDRVLCSKNPLGQILDSGIRRPADAVHAGRGAERDLGLLVQNVAR